MKIERIEFIYADLPLVRPFQTSFSTQTKRHLIVIKVHTNVGVGWSECVAMAEPLYSSEYLAACVDVIKSFFLPALKNAGEFEVSQISKILEPFLGHPMAKAALETACLDAQLKSEGRSFAQFFGATRTKVDCGVSVGISPSLAQLEEEVASYVEQGYKRIKLKIQPGWDIKPVGRIRELYPDTLLQVDANQAYTRNDIDHLLQLDQFNLLLNEQPLHEHDILGHAKLAARAKTPVCLDESIISLQTAQDAIEMKATTVINIKPGRVGGYFESKAIHDHCQSIKIDVWCGGMLESGIGRAANVALASLDGFTLPGDTSASSRYYKQDITEPFIMKNGQLDVPTGPGIGVNVDEEFLNSISGKREEVKF
jgi:O-succinylbenzoate synthase